jgi:DNA-binding transcriptional regulator YiaG
LETPVTQVNEIKRRLRRLRSSSITIGIISSVSVALLLLASLWLLISLLDMSLGIPRIFLRGIAVVGFAAALIVLTYEMLRVFSVSHSIKAYAARVGIELKDLGLDLLTALDLSEVDSEKLGYSETLLKKAIEGIASKVRDFDLRVSFRRRTLVRSSIPLMIICLGGLLWWRYDAPGLSYSLTRLGFFWGLSDHSGISISVEPGDDEILAGAAVEVRAGVTGFSPGTPELHVISGGQETAFVMDRMDSASVRGHARFSAGLTKVDRDIAYFVSVGDQSTRIFQISVYEEPRIKTGAIRLAYPAHTGLGSEVLPQGMWDIAAPYGTVAAWELRTNCMADSAWLSIVRADGGGRDLPFMVSRDSLGLRMLLSEDFTYSVELIADRQLKAAPHGPHSVAVAQDQQPYVRIESPQQEIMLEPDMIVPLSVFALDDYGISMMKLFYGSPGESGAVDLPYSGSTQARSEYNWDVGQIDLFPGDAISYYIVVADNDALTGPKQSKTDKYVARVPSILDVYEEIERQQDEELEDLEEIAEEAREIKEDFDDLMEDVRRKREIGWEEEQAVKQSVAEQDELSRRVDEVSSSLDETLELMGENSLVDFEIIDKMEEIRRLLNEVATEEMMRAIEKMREVMESLSPEEIQAAMENLNLSQEDLLRRLDRTIEMLKRLKLQQKMDAAVNLANRMTETQKQTNESLREGDDMGEAEKAEKGLLKDKEVLEEMMKELADLLNAEGNPVAGDLERASEFMESSQIGAGMSMAQSAMASGNRQEALKQGEKVEQDLSTLARMLQNAGAALMGSEQQAIVEALRRAMSDLIEVSKRQEDVLQDVEDADRGPLTGDLARREMVYKEALDRIAESLFDVSRKSLFVSPALGLAVLSIGEKMEAASGHLFQGDVRKARRPVKRSLGSLNILIVGLMDATDRASSCPSASGLSDAFQSLEQMCCMQMGINQGTQSLLSQGEEGLSMEARAGMARLAAEQEAVRKGIEELTSEFGNRAEILGRLDDLAGEARRVIEDLRRQSVGEETIRRQERILTRLLNAQRSLRRRDYSQRRKSKTGQPYEVTPPARLSLEDAEEAVRDLIYRGRGYYPPEYEELIRAYFKAISERTVGE